MGFNVPFAGAVSTARHLSEISEVYYIEQRQTGVEFVVTLEELRKIIELNIGYLESGETLARFKKDLKENQIVLPKDLPETIFRTFWSGAYAYGHWGSFQRTKKALPYLRYSAIDDSRTTSCYKQLHDVVRHIDDPFWKQYAPPNHHNCRSTLQALTESNAKTRSQDEQGLNKPPPRVRTEKGWGFNVGENLHAFVRAGIVGLVRKDAKYKAC